MKGVALILAARPKGKGASADKPEAPAPKGEEPAADSSSEDAYAREAFTALRDGDQDGFVQAFKGAVRACVQAENSGEYDEE